MLEFGARQILDMFSPSNFILTDLEILRHTLSKGGINVVRGNMAKLGRYQR